MKTPVERIPILDLKTTFVEMLQAAKDQRNPEMGLLAVSVIEYLKDAQRWAYVQEHYVSVLDANIGEMTAKAFKEWVDEKLK